MKHIVLYLLAALLFLVQVPQAAAQARPTKEKVSFEVDSLPSQLLRYLNGNSKAEEKIAANTAGEQL